MDAIPNAISANDLLKPRESGTVILKLGDKELKITKFTQTIGPDCYTTDPAPNPTQITKILENLANEDGEFDDLQNRGKLDPVITTVKGYEEGKIGVQDLEQRFSQYTGTFPNVSENLRQIKLATIFSKAGKTKI